MYSLVLDLIKMGNVLSGTFSLISVINYLIFQKKKDFFLFTFHISYLGLDESALNIPPSVANFGYLLSTYSLLFGVAYITLIYTSIIEYIFDSISQQRSQKRIEKIYLLTICISMLIALYPIFEQEENLKDYIQQRQFNNLLLLVIFPSVLFFYCVFQMYRAYQKRLTYSKEMRSLLINNKMLIEPKIILCFIFYHICSLSYSFIDQQSDSQKSREWEIPYSLMGFITSVHYICFSGLFSSTIIDKIKSAFIEDGFIEEQSLAGDPHNESDFIDCEKQ